MHSVLLVRYGEITSNTQITPCLWKHETQASLSDYAHFTASLHKLKKLMLQAVTQQ